MVESLQKKLYKNIKKYAKKCLCKKESNLILQINVLKVMSNKSYLIKMFLVKNIIKFKKMLEEVGKVETVKT